MSLYLVKKDKLKKIWIWFFVFCMAFEVFSFFLIDLRFQVPPFGASNQLLELVASLQGIIIRNFFFAEPIGFLLLYFCALKKPGTGLVTFSIVIGSVWTLYLLFSFPSQQALYFRLLNYFNTQGDTVNLWNLMCTKRMLFFINAQSFLNMVSFVLLFPTRKINKKLQIEEFNSFSFNQEKMSEMIASKNLEDLMNLYSQNVKEHPEFEKHYTKKYRELKKQLTC